MVKNCPVLCKDLFTPSVLDALHISSSISKMCVFNVIEFSGPMSHMYVLYRCHLHMCHRAEGVN